MSSTASRAAVWHISTTVGRGCDAEPVAKPVWKEQTLHCLTPRELWVSSAEVRTEEGVFETDENEDETTG